jgi:hypothetical protein
MGQDQMFIIQQYKAIDVVRMKRNYQRSTRNASGSQRVEMSSNIKHFLKDIGMAYQEFPTQIILQLLKHSEINKEQAITHLTKLFVELKIPHLNTYQGSKEFVENHLKHPYLTEKELR